MPVFTRESLPKLIKEGTPAQVYLFFGDRFLCQEAAAGLCKKLLEAGGTVHPIDGDNEDPATTLAKLRSYSLLPGKQIYRINDTRLFHSKKVAKSIWNRATKAYRDNKEELATRALLAFLEAGGLKKNEDQIFTELTAAQWQQHFGFSKPSGELGWADQLLLSDIAGVKSSGPTATSPPELLMKTVEAGIPPANILLLLAEEVDKRKKLYKTLKEKQVIVDLSVDTGASKKAQESQKAVLQQLINKTQKEFGKTLAPGLAELLFERVGFYPVALVMETEKLLLSIGERQQATRDDLDAIVGRTRQEALFELTGAIGKRNLEQALVLTERLLQNNIHALAIIATLRNFARSLLLIRSLLERPQFHFQSSMAAQAFQSQCLPRLKEDPDWGKEFAGHPYAVYMQCRTAFQFSLSELKHWMQLLLQAEFRLKGSPISQETLLQHLLLSMLNNSSA